jgi:hypothetical protein
MDNHAAETWELVKAIVGRTVDKIYLVAYQFHDETKWENTPLQISFVDGSVLLLDAAGDGETLRAQASSWIDPFAGELSQANKEFVQTHGKWKLLDVSFQNSFSLLLNESVKSVNPIYDRFGALSGVQISIAEQYLNFVVEWDECHIFWGKVNPDLLDRGNVVSHETPDTKQTT